jgi:hypothetical protein
MDLPVMPPVQPMLTRLARELPRDGLLYEPKWDGFRCLAFRSGDDVDLRSRHDRSLARYFPEVVDGLRRLAERAATGSSGCSRTPGRRSTSRRPPATWKSPPRGSSASTALDI